MHLGPGQQHPLPWAGAVNKQQAGTMATWTPALGRGAGLLLPASPQLTLHLLGLPYPGYPSRAATGPRGPPWARRLGGSTKERRAEPESLLAQDGGPQGPGVCSLPLPGPCPSRGLGLLTHSHSRPWLHSTAGSHVAPFSKLLLLLLPGRSLASTARSPLGTSPGPLRPPLPGVGGRDQD